MPASPMLVSTFTPVYLSPRRGRILLIVWTIVFLLSLCGLMLLRRTGLFIPSILVVCLWLASIFGIILGLRYTFWAPLLYRVSSREIEVFYDAKRNGFVTQPLRIPRDQIAEVSREENWVRLQLIPNHNLEIERFNRRKEATDDAIYLADEGLLVALN